MPFPSMDSLTEIIGTDPTVSRHGDVRFSITTGRIELTVEFLAHGAMTLDIAVEGVRLVHIGGPVDQVSVFSAPRASGLDIQMRGPDAPAPFLLRIKPTIEVCWAG